MLSDMSAPPAPPHSATARGPRSSMIAVSFSAISSSACSLPIASKVPSGRRRCVERMRSGWLCWSCRWRPLMQVYPP